jgi:uncharacterized protein (DUF885 family)
MTAATEPARGNGSTFRSFLDDDWTEWISEYPELGTQFGVPGFNDRWADDTANGIEHRRTHLERSRHRLSEFEASQLPPSDRLNHDLYRTLLDAAKQGLQFGFDPLPFDLGQPHNLRMPMNQMEGTHLTATDVLEMAPRDRLSDFDDRLTRLRSLGTALLQQKTLLEAGRAAGFTPPRVAVMGLSVQVRNLIRPDPEESALLSSFAHLPPAIGPSDQTRVRSEARAIYTQEVVPALTSLGDYLDSTYLPACRETVGASALPDGPSMYAYLVRRMTTTSLTPDQIHEIGLREVERLSTEMESIRTRTGFVGTSSDFREYLRTDPRFYWAEGEELLNGYRVIAKKIDPELGSLFGRLPRLPYGVLPVPSFREKSSPAAYYFGGAPSTGRAGHFFANTYQVGIRPRWEMEALTLHEAVPGHHLQLALAQELDHLPEFRRWSGPTAFVEGWGLYAESLGEELGCYQDPYSKFGQLTFDTWRSIRLVVDTGMHAMGWTRDRAIQFFRDHTSMSDVGIAVEVDRYIVWPGQALGYKIGQLKIREMRTLSERRLQDRFEVRAFHDRVLGEGALPLNLLERRVVEWIDQQPGA